MHPIINDLEELKKELYFFVSRKYLVERLDGLIKKYTPPPAEKPSFEGEDE